MNETNLRLPHPGGNSRADIELARLRTAAVDAATSRREGGYDDDALHRKMRISADHLSYRWQDHSHGVPHNSARRVSPQWKIQRIDRRPCVTFGEDGQLPVEDFASEFAVVYKVRWLTGPKSGQVEKLDARGYFMAKSLYFQSNNPHHVEPVPDDEPECPPARPAKMPSSFTKAKAIAGKMLKRPPEDLTFDEVVAYFRTK